MTDMTSSPARIQEVLNFAANPFYSACGCMGPRDGDPVCSCAMSSVIRWRGVWLQITKLEIEKPEAGYLDEITNLADVPVTEMTSDQRKKRLEELRGWKSFVAVEEIDCATCEGRGYLLTDIDPECGVCEGRGKIAA